MKVAKQKKILLTFVGTNDSAGLSGKGEGAIITAIKNEKFDELILLCNDRVIDNYTFKDVAAYIGETAQRKKLVKKVTILDVPLKDVTDHNEIYLRLREIVNRLPKNRETIYTAAISSGTPAMQVCWILLAESGDFSIEYPLRLIKVKDPKFGISGNIEVKLDSSLPRIMRLEKEVTQLKSELLPVAIIDIKKGILIIDGQQVDLTPMEFCYYRYFAEKKHEGTAAVRIGGIETPEEFPRFIYNYHEETFPALDLLREDLRKTVRAGQGMAISTFRGNITKLNRKITEVFFEETIQNYFTVSAEGKRGAKFYTIKAPPEKLKILG